MRPANEMASLARPRRPVVLEAELLLGRHRSVVFCVGAVLAIWPKRDL